MSYGPGSLFFWVGLLLCLHKSMPLEISDRIETFYVRDLCYEEIGTNTAVGRIKFDSNYMTSDTCAWEINGYKGIQSRLRLNFTQFSVYPWCFDSNLTVRDIWNQPLAGLSPALCGNNVTLLHSSFNSVNNYVSMKFSRNLQGRKFHSTFTLIFSSYRDVGCETSDTWFKCNNGRCIQNSTRCLGVNPCGDDSDCKTPESENKGILNNILEGIKNYAPWAGLLVGIYILYYILAAARKKFYAYRAKRNSSFESENSIGSMRSLNARTLDEPNDQHRNQTTDVIPDSDSSSFNFEHLHSPRNDTTIGDTREPGAPPAYDTVLNSPGDTHNDYGAFNNSYPTPPTAPTTEDDSQSSPRAPPPSYEDVMSNQTNYLK